LLPPKIMGVAGHRTRVDNGVDTFFGNGVHAHEPIGVGRAHGEREKDIREDG
jgi:hypothetical protein